MNDSLVSCSGLARAVDCHAHVFNPALYVYHASGFRHIEPNETGTAEAYRTLLGCHGFSNAVLVNPVSSYGEDHRYLLSAIAASEGVFKGVALVGVDTTDTEIERWREAGIVGVRLNINPFATSHRFAPADDRLLARLRAFGLVAQVHYMYIGREIVELLPRLARSGVVAVFDHCGRPDVGRGLPQPEFQALLAFARTGQGYIKLSSAFRLSREAWPHEDVTPYIEALVDAFTIDRCIWGSDWPFTGMTTRVDYGPALALLGRWIRDPGDRRKVLWDNPARLFGF